MSPNIHSYSSNRAMPFVSLLQKDAACTDVSADISGLGIYIENLFSADISASDEITSKQVN